MQMIVGKRCWQHPKEVLFTTSYHRIYYDVRECTTLPYRMINLDNLQIQILSTTLLDTVVTQQNTKKRRERDHGETGRKQPPCCDWCAYA